MYRNAVWPPPARAKADAGDGCTWEIIRAQCSFVFYRIVCAAGRAEARRAGAGGPQLGSSSCTRVFWVGMELELLRVPHVLASKRE